MRGVRLGRVLRLVPGDRQDPAALRRRGLAAAGAGPRAGHLPAPAAPLHALRDGGDLVRHRATCASTCTGRRPSLLIDGRRYPAPSRPGGTKTRSARWRWSWTSCGPCATCAASAASTPAAGSRPTSSPTRRWPSTPRRSKPLARVRPLHIVADRADAPSEAVATAVLDGATVVLPLAGLFDSSAERANLEKQRDRCGGGGRNACGPSSRTRASPAARRRTSSRTPATA